MNGRIQVDSILFHSGQFFEFTLAVNMFSSGYPETDSEMESKHCIFLRISVKLSQEPVVHLKWIK